MEVRPALFFFNTHTHINVTQGNASRSFLIIRLNDLVYVKYLLPI